MHLLDLLKPKARPKYGRRKTIDGGSVLSDSSNASTRGPPEPELDVWDPWARALDGLPAAPGKHVRSSTGGIVKNRGDHKEQHWNTVESRRPATSHAPSSFRSDDTASVRSDITGSTRRAPSTRRHAPSARAQSATPSLAPTYLPTPTEAGRSTRATPFRSATAPGHIPTSEFTFAGDEDDGFVSVSAPTYGGLGQVHEPLHLRDSPSPLPTHMHTRSPERAARSVHGSVHRDRDRDMSPGAGASRKHRAVSPAPSAAMSSSSIVHTLPNGTKISVPTAVPASDSSARSLRSDASERRRTFYIIPPGMNVIFRDGEGNEVGRVGEFDLVPRKVAELPIVLKDEQGRIIYQTGEGERTTYEVEDDDDSDKPNVIHLGSYVPESQRSLPITVSLDERAKDMIIYGAGKKSPPRNSRPLAKTALSDTRVSRSSYRDRSRDNSAQSSIYLSNATRSVPSLHRNFSEV